MASKCQSCSKFAIKKIRVLSGALMSFTYKIDATMGLLYYAGVDTNAAEMFQAENSASDDP